MSRTRQIRTIALVAALLVAAAGAVPAAATAAEPLQVGVDQGRNGSVFVTVTSNDTAVAGAEVTVSTTDENATYDGEGTYETDANGSVALPVPDADVTVNVTATDANRTAATTATLEVPSLAIESEQGPDGTATVWVSYTTTDEPAADASVDVSTVDENDTYAGTGSYTTDENGTVTLPAPETTTTLQLDVSAGDLEKNTTVMLQNASAVGETYDSFGAQVSAFVHSLLGQHDGGIGRMVADFVTENNPGNAPEYAGPPADGERGPPDSVGAQGGNSTTIQGADGGNGGGPPADKGPDKGEDHPGKAKGR